MNINIGGLYTYKQRIAVSVAGQPVREIISSGKMFVVLEEITDKHGYTHLKVLTTNGVVGYLEYITKQYLEEVKS